ncbi:uncharacterized protein RJT21DRAFT_118258 [Scheffersomyces amazonensis]|uniref:uncharacterized protein n=1 Tax=Scheffersomyces amazonensis TaxID=1078765 RepID=UPI00315CCA3B
MTGLSVKEDDSSNNVSNATIDDVLDSNNLQVDQNDKSGTTKQRRYSASLVDVEDETEHNTKMNALLYHTNNDTVDLYRQQNNSSDLLGRLYYDDYDSDSIISPVTSADGTPLLTPNLTGNSNIPPLDLLLASNSSLNLSASRSNTSLPTRPGLNRLKSFERSISFDTTTNNHRKSITLKVKHPQFKFRRNNKTFLAGYNNDHESIKAIEWLFDEMLIHGDTIVILQVLDEKQFEFIDKEKANRSLERIDRLNTKFKKIAIVFEVVIGKPQKLLKAAIDEYNPNMMIIGSHHYDGKEHHRSLLSKSPISKHFLECALVPVILVKPNYHHQEMLIKPIDSINYFADWIKNIDVTDTYNKKRTKKPSSRTGSYTNMAALVPDRGKPLLQPPHLIPTLAPEERGRSNQSLDSAHRLSSPGSRSTSRTRGLSKFFTHK